MVDGFTIIERVPTVEEYIKLRSAVGWAIPNKESIQKGLSNSLYTVCVEFEGKIIGTGRVIGDGALAYYIQDVIVLPEFQNRGIGSLIMDSIMHYLKKNCTPNTVVGLMAAKDVSPFYQKYGFIPRPDDKHGPGMFIRWSDKEGYRPC